MKPKILIGLTKAIITWMVENYNPYANVPLFILCFNQNTKELKWVGKVVRDWIDAAIRSLSDARALRFGEEEKIN